MGCYDSLLVNCPKCETELEFQSKSGDCKLALYDLNNVPNNVLMDVNRHSPIHCPHCNNAYRIKLTPTIVRVK